MIVSGDVAAGALGTSATAGPAQPRRRRRGRWIPYALIAPFGAIFLVFVIGPLLVALYNSLFVDRLIGGRSFVWFDNYLRAFGDPSFWAGFGRVLLYGGVFIPLVIVIPLTLALVLDNVAVRHGGVYRLLFFLPYAVPGVIATLMWGFLYGPTISPVTDIAGRLGIHGVNLLSSGAIIWSIGNIGLWMWAGYNMIILYTALRTIPPDLYEAARIDGAGSWRVALSIKVPMIAPVITMIVIFSIIGTLQLFTEPLVLQPLAPKVIRSDFTPNLYAYTLAATGQQLNYVSALSFVLAAIVAIASVIYLRVTRRSSGVSS